MDLNDFPQISPLEDNNVKNSTILPLKHIDNRVAKHTNEGQSFDLTDFLNLMKLACDVNDMISNGQQQKQFLQNDIDIDFQKLAENRLVNEFLDKHKPQSKNALVNVVGSLAETSSNHGHGIMRASQRTVRSEKLPQTEYGGLHPNLNDKLNYVISEGLIDNVLPFVCPVEIPSKFSTLRTKNKQKDFQSKTLSATTCIVALESEKEVILANPIKEKDKDVVVRRKSNVELPSTKKELEVVIHVCDELKKTSRDFTCPPALLISKMKYFADITAGQKLEDMDISVHCDLQIFEWLMSWVKYSTIIEQGVNTPLENEPKLDAHNVVPILVSAKFLQMEPLLLECLSFCHSHLSEVVRISPNLTCLNEALITRLAAMFTNVELEAVRDKKDRITPRIWTKLITSLCEPEPEVLRGHYYSLSDLFRCLKCGKYLTHTMKSFISCHPSHIRLNRWGQLVSYHLRDSSFNLNTFICQLFKEQKSWRKVYWKLWAYSHVLYCCICETHFPISQMNWCRFHPDGPNFLGPISEGRAPGPAGRYPCCGQHAFRFETLPGPSGCQFREHNILVENDRERAILSIAQLVSETSSLCDTPPVRLQEAVLGGEVGPRWMGLSLMPQRSRQGLVPPINPVEPITRITRRTRYGGGTNHRSDSTSDTETSNSFVRRRTKAFLRDTSSYDTSTSTTADEEGCESDEHRRRGKDKKKKKRRMECSGRYWSGEVSARSNQDFQREYEEKVMKLIITIVSKKIGFDHMLTHNPLPRGGVYLRLETEWKEQCRQRNNNMNYTHNNNYTNPNPNSSSGINSNVPSTALIKQKNK